MSSVHLCPVCGGTGTVPATFYNEDQYSTANNTGQVTCKACGGQGVIIVRDVYPISGGEQP